MLSTLQDKRVARIIGELRAKGMSNLDIYLALKTLMPGKNLDYLLTPSELELINRLSKLRAELYYLRNIVSTMERRIMKRHELILSIYNELSSKLAGNALT
ncbi:hypothetical protein [Vulcanisaeta thermophila]|uniref:hypothetical protein n=1 Tax=Vulcanisaeta thermophila TaxID=867917 RepID=UPI000853482C|nr:hypothetical protein [Vulcanisaeta thermophila]